MSDSTDNMFLYVGTYTNKDDAQSDYDAFLDLHKEGFVGAYDVGVVVKDADGKLDIDRHTSDTGKGAWTGTAVGALFGLVFPPSILGAGLVGAGTGAAIGHSMNQISKDDLQDLGELIKGNESALVVIGESKVQEMLEKAVTKAVDQYSKEFEANAKDFRQQLKEAEKELESESADSDSSS